MLSSPRYEHLMNARKTLMKPNHTSKRSLQLPRDIDKRMPPINVSNQEPGMYSQRSPQNQSQSYNLLSMASNNKLILNEMTEISSSNHKVSDLLVTEMVYQQMVKRLEALELIIESLVSDPQRELKETLKQLTITLADASRNEIMLAQSQRENEQRKMNQSNQQLQMNKLLEKLDDLRKNNQVDQMILEQAIENWKDENKKLLKKNLHLGKENNTLTQQIKVLESRMTLILESDIMVQENGGSGNKLLQSLNQVLKENEQLKKETSHIRQENLRYQGLIKTLEQNVLRLNARIIKYETKQNFADKPNDQPQTSSDIDLLQTFKIPHNLSYKIMGQKINYQNLFYELLEIGPKQMARKVQQEEREKVTERLEYFTTQLLQYKEHTEKFNNLAKFLEDMLSKNTVQDVITTVNTNLTPIFSCEYIKLWVIDAMTGMIYTYVQSNIEQRACTYKGLISDIFKYRRAANYFDSQCKKPILYRTGDQEYAEHCKQCLLIPIFASGNTIIRGVLQISNSESDLFGFDEEYFAIVVAKMLEKVLRRVVEHNLIHMQSKYFPLIIDAFEQLMQTKNQYEFQHFVKRWMTNIFGISSVLFYFIEDGQLKIYQAQDSYSYYPFGSGLVGLVARTQQGLIINNVKQSSVYNENVDMKSLLPIYCIPLVYEGVLGEEQTLAVLQLPLKSRFLGHLEKDKLICPGEEYSGMDENIQKQILRFTKIIIIALRNISWNQK